MEKPRDDLTTEEWQQLQEDLVEDYRAIASGAFNTMHPVELAQARSLIALALMACTNTLQV